MSAYPSIIPSFTVKVNQTDINWADHVNRLQDEVVALARELGTVPKAEFANVAARLAHLQSTKSDVGHVHDDRYVQLSLATSKGDLVVASGSGTFVAVSAGVAGQALLSDPAQVSGVKWSTIRHDGLPGLANDDHPQYLTETRHNGLSHLGVFSNRSIRDLGDVASVAPNVGEVLQWNGANYAPQPESDTSHHGHQSGLEDDDHLQYLTPARHHDRAVHDAIGLTHNSLTGLTSGHPHTQYPRKTANETIPGVWEFTGHPLVNNNPVAAMMDGGRRIYVRGTAPAGTVSNGDLWFRP